MNVNQIMKKNAVSRNCPGVNSGKSVKKGFIEKKSAAKLFTKTRFFFPFIDI